MTSSNTYNQQKAIKAALQTMMVNEQSPGGRLSAFKAIARSRENQLGEAYYPYIGISVVSRSEPAVASHRLESSLDFAITVIARSTISLEDATDQLDNLLDDGTGNGVEQVLRDPNNYFFNGLVVRSGIKDVQFFDSIQGDPSQSPNGFLAYGVIFFTTLQVITQ